MISLIEVVNDPDFAQNFVITRSSGSFNTSGIWSNVQTAVSAYGILQPATNEELEQIPDGDRVKGVISVHTSQVIYETHTTATNDVNAGISDLIIWNLQNWRIVKLFPWQDFGYFKGLCVRMSGE